MGVETFRVEWGKPPELEKSYGRWPKRMEEDLWPLEDNHFGASFCFTERSLLLDYMKKILWYNTIFVSWPFFQFISFESETLFFSPIVISLPTIYLISQLGTILLYWNWFLDFSKVTKVPSREEKWSWKLKRLEKNILFHFNTTFRLWYGFFRCWTCNGQFHKNIDNKSC